MTSRGSNPTIGMPMKGTALTGTRILVVDDEESARDGLVKLLRADGFVTSAAPDGEAAVAEARRALPDVVLTDRNMPGMDGVELCRRLHEIDPDLPVIIMTAFSDMDAVIGGLRAGAADYLLKPLQYEAVVVCMERAIARRGVKLEQERLRRENETLYRTLNERLVTSSVREQEHAEAEAHQRAQLNALFENLGEGVFMAEPHGQVLMINEAARTILGTAGGDLRTVEALDSLELHDLGGRPLDQAGRPLVRALKGERFKDYEVVLLRSDGDRRRLVSTGTSVRDANGNVTVAVVVVRDVTDLRRLEQQRDEYLALISHDLRNPLAAMSLFVQTLTRSLEKKGLAEDVHIAGRVARNVRRMTTMIEELSESTSLEASGVTLRRVPVDLRELVVGVVHDMDDAQAGRITIETEDASPLRVFADVSRLERVVGNLFTNALKYSAEDAPVKARLARRGSEVELEVTDVGIGIAPESLKMLFERYYRTAGGKARAAGLGLGLYIARLIVEGHGGRIEVSSQVGKGSTFRVILPALAPSC
jgi:PAS domain S-box-containing protein